MSRSLGDPPPAATFIPISVDSGDLQELNRLGRLAGVSVDTVTEAVGQQVAASVSGGGGAGSRSVKSGDGGPGAALLKAASCCCLAGIIFQFVHTVPVLNAGKERAEALVSTYARLDLLRPYFNVEPADIIHRLLASLWPQFSTKPQAIAADLYGPLMLALTLAAVLLMGMKSTGHMATREGTLIGTALALSLGYWLTLSGLVYALSFIFNTKLSAVELLASTGYSLFAYCLALTASHILPQSHHDFLIAWIVFGTLAALRLGLMLRSRTPDPKQGFLVFITVVGVHWTYLLYLNFAYISISEAMTNARGK